jgi:hypothetical protein
LSHIVTIATQIKDPTAIRAACERLHLDPPVEGTFKLFSGAAAGMAVQLPNWRYPVVFDTESGEVRYDNFEERWGKQVDLDALRQAYAVEKAKIEARRQGQSIVEQPLADGSIKLTIQIGGAV